MADSDNRVLGADAIVLSEDGVLLVERDHDPYEGEWVLPGGVVSPDETAREACVREASEEVGLDVAPISFVGLYDDPDRDPRGNVSATFLCRPVGGEPEPRSEGTRVDTFDPENLPEMGFDHARIVTDALVP